jgi:hypothetical protein
MDQQLQLALTGFKDSSSDELYTGIYRFWTYRRNMELGMISANQAKKGCHTIVLPTWVPS